MIKIGIDFHATYTDNPAKWTSFCKRIKEHGGEVHIITGARYETFSEECNSLGIEIPYTNFFSITDYYLGVNPDIVDMSDPEHPRIHNKQLWDMAKSIYCQTEGITLMIDNEAEYGKYFCTPFLLYKKGNLQ